MRLSHQPTLQSLPTATPPKKRIAAYLIDEASGDQAYTFLLNPSRMSWSRSVTYKEAITAGTSVQTQQYSHTGGRVLDISDLILETHWEGKSISPLLERLQTLLQPQIEADWYAPSPLAFVWGQTTFSPCILTSLKWEETAWLSGAPSSAKVSISLTEIPPPDTAPVEGESALDTATSEGELAFNLTDRQQVDAIAQAESYLRSNTRSLSAQVRDSLLSGDFALTPDPSTGNVTISRGTNTLGRVGRWDGRTFDASVGTV